MTKFNEGDKVNHLSNSDYKMIISFVYTGQYDGKYTCTWLDKKGKPHCKTFFEFELEPYE